MTSRAARSIAHAATLALACACGAAANDPDLPERVFAASVERFEPGDHAGFGQGDLPEAVLGPPSADREGGGSLDVVSLGVGGEIVLGFGEFELVDGPGADLIVFENPFWPGGDPTMVFAEPAEVAVSEDGDDFLAFTCDPEGAGAGRFPGCAGWTPTREFDPDAPEPLDPELTGGDAFDLADLGAERARFVRITDLSSDGDGTSAGFDIDAVGLVHFERAAR